MNILSWSIFLGVDEIDAGGLCRWMCSSVRCSTPRARRIAILNRLRSFSQHSASFSSSLVRHVHHMSTITYIHIFTTVASAFFFTQLFVVRIIDSQSRWRALNIYVSLRARIIASVINYSQWCSITKWRRARIQQTANKLGLIGWSNACAWFIAA